uniref:Major facilitator superfamily (MFS) profile domain-containing protein n=1 Tax=Pseudonaja textilis TaxID=8673 RepID=A0A670ZLJ3_PSETE
MAPAKGQRRLSLCPGPPVAAIPFGDLLEEVGSMGTFQIFSVFFLSLPVLFLASHNLVQNFSAATPEHRCRLAQPGNLSRQENLVPLGEDLKPDRCRRFTGWLAPNSNDTAGKEAGLEPCLDGWQYDHSTFASTIVTEWDLVCNLQPLKSLAQSLFMGGVLVGAFVLGDLSDRYGRRLILIGSLLMVAIMGTGAAFSNSFLTYCIFRFLSGIGISGFLLNYICLSLEWVPTKYRAVVVSIQSYCSTAGQVLLGGLAYAIRDWRWLQLAISAPFFAFFAYSWWLPESARWLLMNNEREAALRNLKHVARINGKAAAGEAVVLEVRSNEVSLSFSMNMAYFGLSMDLSMFDMNVFLVQLFFGAIDLVAKMVCALLLSYVGRRIIQSVSLILAGMFLLVSLPVPSDMLTVRLVFVVLGKGCLAASSMCLYLYGGELFPTVIRQTGSSFTTVMARLGGIIAPLVLMAGDYQPFLPLVIFGVTPVVSGVSAVLLPEMFNVPLLDTVEEVEERWVTFPIASFSFPTRERSLASATEKNNQGPRWASSGRLEANRLS